MQLVNDLAHKERLTKPKSWRDLRSLFLIRVLPIDLGD